MADIRLNGIHSSSGAIIIADLKLVGGSRPSGPYISFEARPGRYRVQWALSDGTEGIGNIIVQSGRVVVVDPVYLKNLQGKQKEWAERKHLYGKFPTNGTITIHGTKVNANFSMILRFTVKLRA